MEKDTLFRSRGKLILEKADMVLAGLSPCHTITISHCHGYTTLSTTPRTEHSPPPPPPPLPSPSPLPPHSWHVSSSKSSEIPLSTPSTSATACCTAFSCREGGGQGSRKRKERGGRESGGEEEKRVKELPEGVWPEGVWPRYLTVQWADGAMLGHH